MIADPSCNEADMELKTLMTEHDLDEDTTERTQELVDEGLDKNGTVE